MITNEKKTLETGVKSKKVNDLIIFTDKNNLFFKRVISIYFNHAKKRTSKSLNEMFYGLLHDVIDYLGNDLKLSQEEKKEYIRSYIYNYKNWLKGKF